MSSDDNTCEIPDKVWGKDHGNGILYQLSIDLQLIWLNMIKYEYNMSTIWYKYVTIKYVP